MINHIFFSKQIIYFIIKSLEIFKIFNQNKYNIFIIQKQI